MFPLKSRRVLRWSSVSFFFVGEVRVWERRHLVARAVSKLPLAWLPMDPAPLHDIQLPLLFQPWASHAQSCADSAQPWSAAASPCCPGCMGLRVCKALRGHWMQGFNGNLLIFVNTPSAVFAVVPKCIQFPTPIIFPRIFNGLKRST